MLFRIFTAWPAPASPQCVTSLAMWRNSSSIPRESGLGRPDHDRQGAVDRGLPRARATSCVGRRRWHGLQTPHRGGAPATPVRCCSRSPSSQAVPWRWNHHRSLLSQGIPARLPCRPAVTEGWSCSSRHQSRRSKPTFTPSAARRFGRAPSPVEAASTVAPLFLARLRRIRLAHRAHADKSNLFRHFRPIALVWSSRSSCHGIVDAETDARQQVGGAGPPDEIADAVADARELHPDVQRLHAGVEFEQCI